MPKMPIEIKGLAETLSAMRAFEPDLAKNLTRQVRTALTPVQKKAQGFVPSEITGLSNWMLKTKGRKITKSTSAFAAVGHFPKFNGAIVRRGIKVSIGKSRPNRNGFVSFYRLSNFTAAGAIYETAGRANGKSHRKYSSNNPNAGKHFIDSMSASREGQGKMNGRLIYKAVAEDEGKTIATIVKAVEMSVAQFKKRSQYQAFRTMK